MLTWVELSHGTVTVNCAGDSHVELSAAMTFWQSVIPKGETTQEETVRVRFWYYGQHGANSISRYVTVPKWAEIAENYTASVREAVGGLMRDFRPSGHGQLLLWHGVPGRASFRCNRATISSSGRSNANCCRSRSRKGWG